MICFASPSPNSRYDLPLDLVGEVLFDQFEVVGLQIFDFGRVIGFGVEVVGCEGYHQSATRDGSSDKEGWTENGKAGLFVVERMTKWRTQLTVEGLHRSQ